VLFVLRTYIEPWTHSNLVSRLVVLEFWSNSWKGSVLAP
jgi:hypothetical protein